MKHLGNREIAFNEDEFELTKEEISLIEFWLSKKGFEPMMTIFPINERVYIDFVSWDRPERKLIIGLHKNMKIIG